MARRDPLARAPGALKGGTLSDSSTFLSQNIKKIERGPFEVKKISKKSHNAEKTERNLRFSNIHSVTKRQKNRRGPFEEKNRKKSHCRKKLKEGKEKKTCISPGIVLHGKKRKTFLVEFLRQNGSI